ncbi:hypothetical protein FB451DRAFT_1422635 [Mycena latifolia]|nr:hypothetical protein FB451DRAFT_1422635 [Mycena latifolia]
MYRTTNYCAHPYGQLRIHDRRALLKRALHRCVLATAQVVLAVVFNLTFVRSADLQGRLPTAAYWWTLFESLATVSDRVELTPSMPPPEHTACSRTANAHAARPGAEDGGGRGGGKDADDEGGATA